MSTITTEDRVVAFRDAKWFVLEIIEMYKKTKVTTLIEGLTFKKKRTDIRLK
jgi:hypothetical protein